MAKRYYGDFRSVDNSADPKGQRYRVVIFTGYDGSNPYGYRTITHPTQHGYDVYVGRVPVNNYALTMTDRPFVVNYEGDDENIYKPYRCSTATINFRQSNINLDFLNSNGTSTLVVLLKWKNEVSEVGGRMYNSSTGETLNKHVVIENPHSEFPITWYNDYDPDRFDNFCFTVEWVGFSTPETFSMEYSHVADTFTLNAQDALSTLQYSKYSWLGDTETDPVVSFNTLLLDYCKSLGTYRKIYVTDTVKLPDVFADVMTKICEQQANNYDEDGKPTDKLGVLEQILTYLNLTAIPYKNNLIVTTPNAIAEGWNYYFTYTLPNNGYIINFPTDGDTYTAQPCEELSDAFTVTQDAFAGGTTIGTNNVYNSVTAECDEYAVGELLPDIHDDKNLNDGYYSAARPNDNENSIWYVWETVYYQSNTPSIETYVYREIVNEGDRWRSDGQQTDLYHAWLYANNQNSSWILDDGGVIQVPYNGAFPNKYSPNRTIYFITPNQYHASRSAVNDKNVYSLNMLYMKSKRGLYNSNQWLQITGDWHFYCNELVYNYPYNKYNMDNSNVVPNNCYVWAKVKFGDKWLKSENASTYNWVDNECFCKLWLYYTSNDQKANQGASYPFRWTKRGIDGIVVKLPVDGDNVKPATFEIWIDKPLGVGTYLPTSATLSNFSFKILSTDYVNSRGRKEDRLTDTVYRTEMVADAIDEFDNVELTLSSASDKGLNYSETVRQTATALKTMPKIYNTATGNYHIPEQHITANIANQYATPTINLQMTLHNGLTPYSLVTWSKMNGKKFVVNSTETDYEYNTQNVTISEVKEATPLTTIRRDTTHNYRRNNDLVFNDNVVADANEMTLANAAVGSATFAASNGYMTATSDDVEIGCLTIQPNFNDCAMQISVPNDLDDTLTVEVEDRQLKITY